MDTLQLDFSVQGATRELLIARLSEAGCDGFEETDNVLSAFLPDEQYDAATIDFIAGELQTSYTVVRIPLQNWNAVWEAGFEPVTVQGFCTVRAAFHEAGHNTPHDIIITPKMSFGTGHHATTRLMIKAMRHLDVNGKQVLDFGTGTGILAILAKQLGAAAVLAIDHDEWSVENAVENIAANGVAGITVQLGSLEAAATHGFDVILANINRHILLQYMSQLHALSAESGILLLSGILTADAAVIEAAAINVGFIKENILQEGDWIAMEFRA